MEIEERGLELLVHNVSHADMFMLLASNETKQPTSADEEELKTVQTHLARPKFNQFQPMSEMILSHIAKMVEMEKPPQPCEAVSKYQVTYPVGLRFDLDGNEAGDISPGAPVGMEANSSERPQSPPLKGFALRRTQTSDTPERLLEMESPGAPSKPTATAPRSGWEHFHLKGQGRKVEEEVAANKSQPSVTAVYLPLVAMLIPEWLRALRRRQNASKDALPPPRKVLILVTGAGQPRDRDANPQDNSTEGTGQIIQRFVKTCYPDIEVITINSAWGIFRYDDNVQFVKEHVLPIIEQKRSEVVSAFGDRWSKHIKVTISLADGAPARIAALNASLRSYQPDYLHIWRLKTFWDERVLSEEDIEFHTFKKLEMRPPMHRSQIPKEYTPLVEDMMRYKRQFEAIRDCQSHELETFWLRKTGKAVLAVLLTTKAEYSKQAFWRGLNLEVSMPTGTLCAERNAIGNAIAADQTMSRHDMQAVAVLSIPLSAEGLKESDSATGAVVALNPLDPCGACMEWLRKIAEVNPDFKVLTFTDTSCEHVYITPIMEYA